MENCLYRFIPSCWLLNHKCFIIQRNIVPQITENATQMFHFASLQVAKNVAMSMFDSWLYINTDQSASMFCCELLA